MKKNTESTKTMNKKSLIASVAELSGLSKKESTNALEAITQSIQNALKKGNDVRISGFGTFLVIQRPEREGHNPRTGKTMKFTAKKSPKFRAGKTLKESIA